MHSMDHNGPALQRVLQSCISKATLITFAVMASASINVSAAITDTFTGACPADTVGQTINCTADDVLIALVTAEEEGVRCIHGATAVLNLNTEIEINAASARHDIAAWIPDTANLGKNMLLTSANGGPSTCLSKGFEFPIGADPDGTGPLVVEDEDGDACGDANGVNDKFTKPFTDATVDCDGTVGGAEVDAVVSWHLGGNDPVCSDHQDYGNFKKSKCSATTSFVDLVVVGKLTVCKAAAADQDFEFTIESGVVWADGTGADEVPTVATSPFNLNPAGVACMTFDVLTAQGGDLNEVTITETDAGGFSVSNISCVNNADGGAAATFTDNGDGFTIGLTEGDIGDGGVDPGQPDVTCTVTNTEGGSITITKDTVPDSGQDFVFIDSGAGIPLETAGLLPVSLDDDADPTLSNTYVMDNLSAGFYSITEEAVVGWDTEVECAGAAVFTASGSTANVELESDDDFSCTFTNTQRGGIRVVKETFPAGDPALFTFSGDLNGDIGDGGVLEDLLVVAGSYSVTETVPAGWDLVSVECDDGNSSGDAGSGIASFNVEPGEIVTCVYTNVKQGSVVINKTAEGGDEEFCWALGLISGPPAQSCTTTVSGSGQTSFMNLPASDEVAEDNYAVAEIVPEDWELVSVACTDVAGADIDPASIDINPGETITCEFLNWKDAFVTIRKQARNGPDDEFCWDTWANGNYSGVCGITSGGNFEITSIPLNNSNDLIGPWSMIEQGPNPPWVLESATCDDGQNPDDFIVEPGDDIVCTFVNTIPISVPVNNPLALLMLMLMMLATGWYFRPQNRSQY